MILERPGALRENMIEPSNYALYIILPHLYPNEEQALSIFILPPEHPSVRQQD